MRMTTARPALDRLVARINAPAFALPAELCGPIYDTILTDARAQKVLMGLFWIASPTLKDGVSVIFRAPLWEVTAASGFERMSGNGPVRDAIPRLKKETWCPMEDGVSGSLLEECRIVEAPEGPMVEWVLDPDVARIFAAPPQFALLDIRSLAALSTPAEIFLYIQLRRIWKRRVRRLVVGVEDIRRIFDRPDLERKRVMEKLRRTTARLSELMGEDILVSSASGLSASDIILEPAGVPRD